MKKTLSAILIPLGLIATFSTAADGLINGLTIFGAAMVVAGYALSESRKPLGQKNRNTH